MSIIAYDGKIIAADRQATLNETRVTCHKLVQLADGAVVGWTGSQDQGLVLLQWYKDGADKTTFPKFMSDKGNHTRLIIAKDGVVSTYETEAIPLTFLDSFGAYGSGRDIAIGALAMGATAVQAVEIASQFDINCGMGIDWFSMIPAK